MGPEIKYTNHAFEQMTRRDIGRATVEAVIMSGEIIRVDERGVRKMSSFGIVVVLDGNLVVTTYRDTDQDPKCRHKRKPRGREEYKPSFLRGKMINERLINHYLRIAAR